MQWLGCNDAVPWLNEAKTQIFQPIQLIFKISKLTCILSVCLAAVRPGCARCRALEISHDKGNDSRFMKMLFQR